MSKGNGRKFRGMGNGLDNFNGRANGVTKSMEERMVDNNTYPRKPSSLETKAPNYKYPETNTDIKEFKNKIK